MTSLAEVYEGLGEDASHEQLVAGTTLFLAGALMVLAGIVIATVNPLSLVGLTAWQAWEPAGILAGLGVPAVIVGIFTVLPASRKVRAAAVIGAGVAMLGVALFEHAYPNRWMGDPTNLTPLVTLVYATGAIATMWCMFIAVANFKTRNDPGGTVTLEVTREGETRVVEVDRDDLPDAIEAAHEAGGVGFVGETPDGTVPTQTNRPRGRAEGSVENQTATAVGSTSGQAGTAENRTPASDGGATAPGVRTPADDAEVLRSTADPVKTADSYCGNCEYFRHVQTSRGIRPYCGYHDEVMDDMDPCDQWTPNSME